MRHRRKTLDLTQPELAERLHCSVNTIKKLETNARRPSKQLAELLAVQFHIPEEQRMLFIEFARGDWRSVPAEIKEDTSWHVSTKSPRSNLPASISSLVGREQAIADIRNYLSMEDIRLVTLIGPPGIGKTRLSIETARTELSNFPDGVFFVALAPLDDSSLIALTIVQALGYVESKNIPARQQLMDGIGEKQMLILLDNCEHLIEEVAPLVSDLLAACSRLKILATSRESIRVPGEWLYPVPVLDIPKESSFIDVETALTFPALTLFAERARAVRPDFALNADNIQVVSSICAQLDGLPLAIELIAARMRLMSPVAFLEHWNPQFVLSADGVRAVSTRQKTLHNAIAWSYNLLSEQEQIVFARLSVFIGGFTPEAAKAVADGGDISQSQVTDLLAQLINKSLVTVVANTVGNDVETRYGMLET
ncbi:MAG: NB-ARC domain-containing protein, partial [Anaerolineae bacterium]|nr:NB-ARC domain-containing protein [Anaerolineae bacterium]